MRSILGVGATALALSMSPLIHPAAAAPPVNDTCDGAIPIPADAEFPYRTQVVDITEATTLGDPPAPSCEFFSVDDTFRSVWYVFTPPATGTYIISTCSDAPSATTVEDTLLAIYTSPGGCQGPFVEIDGGCNDDFCGPTGFQSSLFATLLADTTYYILVWEWDFDDEPPPPSNSSLQLVVDRFIRPANDTCEEAIPLELNIPVLGSTVGATDDYRLDGTACFQDVVPGNSDANGGDVVYTFTAPEDGFYNFKAYNFGIFGDLVLYVSTECPMGPYPAHVSSCLGAANRNPVSTAEAVTCIPMMAEQSVYVFVDEQGTTDGSGFTLEVTACQAELEPNDTLQTASPWRCGTTAYASPGRDMDYYSLGVLPPDTRVFALLDGEAANLTDFEMRVVVATNTLEFDTDNNDASFADSSPNVAGTPATGENTYLQISFDGSAEVGPYSLYCVVQPPLSSAAMEAEPNDMLTEANSSEANYFLGELDGLRPSADTDVYAFTAEEGETIFLGLDEDPYRDATPVNARLELLDDFGNILVSVNDPASLSSTSTQPGSLFANVPFSPGESLVYHTIIAGTYYARVSIGSASTGPSGSGDYLLSISKNCVTGNFGINSRPAVTGLSMTGPIVAGQAAALTGLIEDADLGQTHSLEIDWGDGSPAALESFWQGETSFHLAHTFPALPSSITSTNYAIRVIVRDNLGRAGLGTLTVTSLRVEPARFASVIWEAQGPVRLEIDGTEGATYRVQSSPDGKEWSDLGMIHFEGTATVEFEDPSDSLPTTRFYRAVAP